MKKNQQRVLSSVLAAGMLTGMAPAALASDIAGHWAQDTMQKFIDNNYLSGYGNDTYGPNRTMSRAEFAALINRVAGLTAGSASISRYTDVPADAWYRADLAKALAAGYLSGVTQTTMAPNATITREQAISMVARVLGLTGGSASYLDRFRDKADVASWAETDIAAMVAAGYVSGNADGTLLPKKELTRAEGVTILNQALDALKKLNGGTTPVDPSKPGASTSGGSSSGGSGGGSPSSTKTYTASSWQELKSAALNAKAGDTIRLSADITDAGSDTTVVDGVSSATLTLNKKNVTFDGNGKTISAAADKTFCFDIDGLAGETTGVTVKDLTIDGGSFASKLGGAMFIEDGAQATIRNVTFKNCRAASASAFNGGGAIFINDHGKTPPAVTVDGCTFENNKVANGTTGRGGAIYADNFRAATAMKLTVKNSTFRGNQAAYGGAIAADGVVDLTVSGCTFEGNVAAVGADDIYLFEGVSAGKKNMTITSNVTAALSGNAYSNETASDTDMQAMNVIFGRYYDATSTAKNTAPEGATDLYFADTDRKELLDTAAAVAMQSVEVNGEAYYYGVNRAMSDEPAFTVNGAAVTATKIGGTNVYYYTAAEQLTGDLYGAATLTYKEFYAGDVSSADSYDAVSSATTSKNTIFQNEDSTEPEEGKGYQINGVKNVPVRVAADQYIKGTIAKAAGVTSVAGYSKAAAVTLNESPSTAVRVYKPLDADGAYGALVAGEGVKVTVSDAALQLSTTSNWGDYQLSVNETSTGYLRNNRSDDGWAVGSNVLGAVVEAQKDGETIRVGMQHLQNIWVQPYQIAFDVSGTDGNVEDTAKLQGATVTKITYIVPEGVYEYTFDGTYIKPKYAAELNLSAAFNSGRTAVTLSGVPAELKDITVSVYYKEGRQTVYAAQNAALENGSVALSEAADPSKTYTVLLSSSNYADLSATISAVMTDEQKAKLNELIATGTALVEADSSLATLKAHIDEARALLENADATSAQAEELIAELTELIAEANPGSKTANGEAAVQTFGYTAKVSVSYDTATGKILSVSDNGTEAGTNSTFWQNATALFAKLIGKTRAEVAGVDGISGATLSSNAIKEAVQSVLPEVEAPSEDLAAWAAYEGGFETFLNYMGENATIDAAWAKAAAKQDTTAGALKAMWSSVCATTTEGQDTPIASMLVSGNTVTFTDADGNTIAAHPYALVDTVEKGLEGTETFVFQTTDKDAGAFTYLAMMKPDMDGEGSMAAHFHFRYGANEAALDLENPKNMWYPTMCDASVTDAERANVILAMYGIEGGVSEPVTEGQKTQLTALTEKAGKLLKIHGAIGEDETAWKALKERYDAAVALLGNEDATSAEAEELLSELPARIDAVLEKAPEVQSCQLVSSFLFGDYYLMTFQSGSEGYVKAVTSVQINGEEAEGWSASNEANGGSDGYISLKFPETLFSGDGTYVFQISADGYKDLEYSLSIGGSVDPSPKTASGSAVVETYGYDAKVLVTFDADGKIISIVDNGTEPGNVNQSFWNTALAMFDKLDGKTKDGVDAVDAVSGATYSSNAIKQAVKNALSD